MLRLDKDRREALARAKAEIAEIMDPLKAAERKQRRQRDREMRKRVGKRAPGQRQPRERDPGYLAFLRRQPCRIGLVAPGTCAGPIQACHVRYSDAARGKRNAGVQAKPSDRYATSCCAAHHAEQHARGNERAWWASYGLNGLDVAAQQFAEYEGAADG